MSKITDDFRKEFQLSKPEAVIQNYSSSLGMNPGMLYISQNYVCFKSQVTSRTERIPLAKTTSIEFSDALSKKLTLKMDKKEFVFSSFGMGQAKEAYVLSTYLWKNPPSIIDAEVLKQHEASLKSTNNNSNPFGDSEQQQEKVKVDTAAADRILALATETDNIQNDVMLRLSEQAEQIDRIENNLDNIEGNLKKANHLMKGIESLPYYLFGGSKDKTKRETVLKDRALKAPKGAPPIFELEVVYKFNDDSLTPSVLVLDSESFRCVNPDTDKLVEKNSEYKYADIETVVMRARHEHMDIRFSGKSRLRLMSAYLQIITNQLYSRCKNIKKDIIVDFEPGVTKFEYKDDRVCMVPPRQRGAKVFGTKGTKTSDLLSADADEQTVKDMDYVDDKLDQISTITSGLVEKGRIIGSEVDRQNEQLARITDKADEATDKTKNLNTRIDKQLK
eukprot:TRINITY_DN193_c2_g1_i1.p1 TRINITY_DN193_c2_g1~~TRINITY_DN193_c2_g1_i1.p1  ORF type:complete len:447 (-),score=101.68 TRINITY_DN193_c2_g1_i1:243-1583(-)